MTTVYTIKVVPSSTDTYNVGRDETWTLTKDRTFETQSEAREYVDAKNSSVPEISTLLLENMSRATEILQGDDYLSYRRYFIGLPDIKCLQHQLRLRGIQVRN